MEQVYDVSVVVPLYYGEKYVKKIIDMINKCKKNFQEKIEIIFVNDSPEEQIDINKICDVKYICNQNNFGIHKSRVIGLSAAKGKYILFLDQDDVIYENFFNNQLKKIENADAVVCNGYYRNNKCIYNMNEDVKFDKECLFLKPNRIISPGQVLIKKDKIPVEWCNNIMKNSGADDYLLWILMILKGCYIKVNYDCLYTHTEGKDNYSFKWGKMALSMMELKKILATSGLLTRELSQRMSQAFDKTIYKYMQYKDIYDALENMKKDGRSIANFFVQKKVSKAAVYGYGALGQKVISDLERYGIKISYVVDLEKDKFNTEYKVYTPFDVLPETEYMIVTPVFAEQEIIDKMKAKNIHKIVTMKEILQN